MNWKKSQSKKRGMSLLLHSIQFQSSKKVSPPSSSAPHFQSAGQLLEVLFYYWREGGPTTKPMRPKNGSLDQNRQWRREAAPIKSILAKNSLRSQIAEKEGFHTLPNSFFLSENGASLHSYNFQKKHWIFSLSWILEQNMSF